MLTDSQLIDAAEAYEDEKDKWGIRQNKAFTPVRYEIIRLTDDDPVVMAWTTGNDTADNEWKEMSQIAAMKAALAALGKE